MFSSTDGKGSNRKKLPRRSSGLPDEWKRENTSYLPASDADANSEGQKEAEYPFIQNLIQITYFLQNEVHKRDAPFPTYQFFPTTDADAYLFSNLPEAGDDGAPGQY